MSNLNELQHLDHITLPVADLQKAMRWYETSFVCRVVEQSATRGVIEFQNVRLVFVLPSQQPQHLAFERADAQSFGQLAPSDDGRSSIYVSDPAGMLVEIIEPLRGRSDRDQSGSNQI